MEFHVGTSNAFPLYIQQDLDTMTTESRNLFISIHKTLRINAEVIQRNSARQHKKSLAVTTALLKKATRQLGTSESPFIWELMKQQKDLRSKIAFLVNPLS